MLLCPSACPSSGNELLSAHIQMSARKLMEANTVAAAMSCFRFISILFHRRKFLRSVGRIG